MNLQPTATTATLNRSAQKSASAEETQLAISKLQPTRRKAAPAAGELVEQKPVHSEGSSPKPASSASSPPHLRRLLARQGETSGGQSVSSHQWESQSLIGGSIASDRRQSSESNQIERHCCCQFKFSPQIMPKSARLVSACFIAELIGTFLLVIIGDGAIAAYVLTKREIDLFVVCFAFGIGAMIATYAVGKISGAHLNPAASLAFALAGKLKWRLLPIYLAAQYFGGFLAALTLFVNYAEAISSLDGGQRSAFGSSNSTGHIFATYPGQWVSIWGSLLDQIIGTAVLLFSLSALSDRSNNGPEERHQPLVIALIIGMVCVSFNPNCGAIFNPARDLSPRLLTALFGYPSVWAPVEGFYWLTAGVIGPHVGAIIGVFAYRLLIGSSLSTKRDYELENISFRQQQQQQPEQQPAKQAQCQAVKFGQQRHHHRQQHQNDEQLSGNNVAEINYGTR